MKDKCLVMVMGAFLVTALTFPSGVNGQEPKEEFSIVGTWKTKEKRLFLGKEIFYKHVTVTFTADGKYTYHCSQKNENEREIIPEHSAKGTYTYEALAANKGKLSIDVASDVGPFFSKGARYIDTVEWASKDRFTVLGPGKVTYQRAAEKAKPSEKAKAGEKPVPDSPGGTPLRLVVQLGHIKSSDFIVSRDKKRLLTFNVNVDAKTYERGRSLEGSACVWDVGSGKQIRTFPPHSDAAASADGRWLVSCSWRSGTVGKWGPARVWDVATGVEMRSFPGATPPLAFSTDGKCLVTGGMDDKVRLWELATGKEIRAFAYASAFPKENRAFPERFVEKVRLSTDGKWLLTEDGSSKVISHHPCVRVWDVATGAEIRVFDGLYASTLSADGKWLVGCSWTAGKYGPARLWEVATGRETHVFHAPGPTQKIFLSPDDQLLVIVSLDGAAHLYDFGTRKLIRTFKGHTKDITSVDLSEDGKWLFTASRRPAARLWNVVTGKEIRTFTDVVFGRFSADAKWLLTCEARKMPKMSYDGTGRVRLWDLATGDEIRTFEGLATDGSSGVAVSRDGKWLVRGCSDNTARLWDLSAGKEIRAFKGHGDRVTSVALSRDGKWLVTGSKDDTARLWDLATGKEIRGFHQQTVEGMEGIRSMALTSDGRWLVTGSEQNCIRVWDIATGKQVRVLSKNPFGLRAPPVALSADGKWLASGGTSERGPLNMAAHLYQLATGKKVGTVYWEPWWETYSMALSGDGKYLVTTDANKARLLQWATGKQIRAFVHDWPVQSVALSVDGKWLVTASRKSAYLWNLGTGEEIRAFRGHDDEIYSVALSADGKWLLTTSDDQTVRLWEVATGKELCRLVSFRDGTWAVVDPQGRYDAANGGDVEGLHWVAGNEPIALKQLKERYWDPGLLAKHMGFNKEPLREVEAFKDVKLFPEAAVKETDLSSGKLNILLSNRGGGIGKVQVFVNGVELLADARGDRFDPAREKAALTIDLASAPTLKPGQGNRITIITWNQEGYLSSRGLDLNWEAPGRKTLRVPELYAILGGIADYSSPALELRFAAKDAEDMAKALAIGARRLFGVDKAHLTLLTSSKKPGTLAPTRANFQKAFEEVRQKAQPNDILFLYLAGHGVSLQTGSDQYCYLTQEARTTDKTVLADPAVRAKSAITISELTEWLKKIPALKKVVILDTCAAGAAATKLTEIRQVTGDQIRAIERMKDRTGFHVLMGCAADRVSFEATPFEQGLLTHALLKGMRGAALKDELLDVSRLFQYAADEVPELARGIGGIQKPVIAAPKGTSFDVGQFTRDDQAAVPLKTPKPLLLRPVLTNRDQDFDNLNLMADLGKRLAEANRPARGKSALAAVYVDAAEMAGALRPVGAYTVKAGKVAVRLRLIRDGTPVQREPLQIQGKAADRETLLRRLVEAISKAVAGSND